MNGQRTLGRCTLIEPIEWTSDGWYKVAARWPRGRDRPVAAEMPMGDDFRGSELGIQWSFHQHYDPARFRLAGGALELEAEGATPGESHPLCLVPMHPAYEIEVDVEAEGGASAGLLLFVNAEQYLGLAISKEGVIRRVQQGYRRYGTQEPEIKRARVTLKMVNDRQDVRFYYRDDSARWRVLQPAMEISAGGAVQAALFASGAGRGRFRAFRYQPLG